MRVARRIVLLSMVGGAAGATVSARAAIAQDARRPNAAQHVLFMCPHGAAKSVLASAYFERLAKERGLNVRVTSAGTEPDAAVAPAVAARLKQQGYPVPAAAPRKASAEDLAKADLVVSLGCDLTGLPTPRGTLQRWDDIPSPSADFAKADDAIRAKVIALVDELVRQQSAAKP